jgi:hypothetical protein
LRILFFLTGLVSAAWCGFLAWVYLAVYDDHAHTANSVWRYLTQLGPLMIYVVVAALTSFLPARIAIRRTNVATALGIAACLTAVMALPVTWRHWRIDCRFPEIKAVHGIAAAIAPLQLGDDRIAVIHPEFDTWFAEAIDYDLRRSVKTSRPPRLFDSPPSYRLDLSALDRARLMATHEVPPVALERRTGDSWSTVLEIPAFRLSGCVSPLH